MGALGWTLAARGRRAAASAQRAGSRAKTASLVRPGDRQRRGQRAEKPAPLRTASSAASRLTPSKASHRVAPPRGWRLSTSGRMAAANPATDPLITPATRLPASTGSAPQKPSPRVAAARVDALRPRSPSRRPPRGSGRDAGQKRQDSFGVAARSRARQRSSRAPAPHRHARRLAHVRIGPRALLGILGAGWRAWPAGGPLSH